MKLIKSTLLITCALTSTLVQAELSCNDQGYMYHERVVDVTTDYNTTVSAVVRNTFTDGWLTGIDAAAYDPGLKDWNYSYLTQWCGSHVPLNAVANYTCQWADEASTVNDTSYVAIKQSYCIDYVAPPRPKLPPEL